MFEIMFCKIPMSVEIKNCILIFPVLYSKSTSLLFTSIRLAYSQNIEIIKNKFKSNKSYLKICHLIAIKAVSAGSFAES